MRYYIIDIGRVKFLVRPIISIEGDRAIDYTWHRIGMPIKFASELGKEITTIQEPREARDNMGYKRVGHEGKMNILKMTYTWSEQWPK